MHSGVPEATSTASDRSDRPPAPRLCRSNTSFASIEPNVVLDYVLKMPPARPLISVVLPVRDCEAFVDESVASILGQDFSDFELIAVDDASFDGTSSRLSRWAELDERVRYFRSERHLGLVGSSSLGIQKASGPLIARMDGDDVSRVDRLRRQVETFEQHPSAVLVASLARGIDERGKVVRPPDLRRLKPGAATFPGPHSSWMFRRSAFDEAGGYAADTDGWEDISLVYRLARRGQILVLPDALLDYRYHSGGSTVNGPQEDRADSIRAFNQQWANGEGDGESSDAMSRAYRLRAGMRVWAGLPPDVPARFPRIGSARWLRSTVPIAAYATWGRLSPRAMRWMMAAMISTRNRFYRHGLKAGEPVTWTSGR